MTQAAAPFTNRLASPAKAPKRATQEERRQEAETRLIASAIELIAQKGFDGFSLAEVGEQAGYSRGLPVHYFDTKENLLVRVAWHVANSFLDRLAQRPETAPGLPSLVQRIREYAATPVSPAQRALCILISHATVHPELYKAISELNAYGRQVLEDTLRIGAEAGNVRADLDHKLVARMIYSFLRGQLSFSVHDPEFDPRAVAEEFIAMITAQLQPPAVQTNETANPSVKAPAAVGRGRVRATRSR